MGDQKPEAGPRGFLRGVRRRRTAAQASVYAASLVVTGLLGTVIQALLTHSMSVAAFGTYGFAVSLLTFLSLFFEFGLFTPAARLAARADELGRRRIVGAALTLFVPVGIGFSVAVFATSLFVNDFVSYDAASPLRLAAIFSIGFPFGLIGQQLAQGVDKLHLFSAARVIGQAALVVALAAIVVTGSSLTANSALLMRSLGLLVGWVLLCRWLQPAFSHARELARELAREARAWGVKIYVGRVASIGTYNMDVLMLGVYRDATTVGLYSLAGSLASAVNIPALAVAAAAFPRMANARRIPERWLRFAWFVSFSSALALFAIAGWLVPLLFGSDFHGAVRYIGPLALAAALRGVTGLYNQYLAAQAQGNALRNAAAILTGTNLIANFALIPPFGGLGAAWASVIALVANLGAHMVGYRRLLRRPPEATV